MPQELAVLLGIKKAPVIAGLIGAIVSLYFIKELTRVRACVAVLGGTACAAYLTPLVLEWMELSPGVENATAFLVGIIGMNLVGGFFYASEKFRRDPMPFIRRDK